MRPALAIAWAIIKKNILSISCGLVAIAAIVALFWPIGGYFTDLQTQVSARSSAYSTAQGLLTKQRTLPVLDPLSTDPVPLSVFPTDTIIARGKTATDAIHGEAGDMVKAATSLVAHQPLVANALPDGGTMEATFFLRKYQALMTFPPTDPEQLPNTLPVSILHAGVPPTDVEIKAQQDEITTEITNQKTQKDSAGNILNQQDVTDQVNQAVISIPAQMRSDVATKNQMYINPTAYHLNPALIGVNPPSTISMFNGQMGLWLLQDVFGALASANADCTGGVPGSRVKHLLLISYTDDFFKPAYSTDPNATPPSADPLHPTRVLTASPTGHVSNGLYDVVPFNLSIVVDAQQIPAVLRALSRDRFITVLSASILTVDSGQAVLAGFVYGDKPVVQLNLSCEELFFRSDTGPYMPDAIKKALGIQPPQPATPAAPAQ